MKTTLGWDLEFLLLYWGETQDRSMSATDEQQYGKVSNYATYIYLVITLILSTYGQFVGWI